MIDTSLIISKLTYKDTYQIQLRDPPKLIHNIWFINMFFET